MPHERSYQNFTSRCFLDVHAWILDVALNMSFGISYRDDMTKRAISDNLNRNFAFTFLVSSQDLVSNKGTPKATVDDDKVLCFSCAVLTVSVLSRT